MGAVLHAAESMVFGRSPASDVSLQTTTRATPGKNLVFFMVTVSSDGTSGRFCLIDTAAALAMFQSMPTKIGMQTTASIDYKWLMHPYRSVRHWAGLRTSRIP